MPTSAEIKRITVPFFEGRWTPRDGDEVASFIADKMREAIGYNDGVVPLRDLLPLLAVERINWIDDPKTTLKALLIPRKKGYLIALNRATTQAKYEPRFVLSHEFGHISRRSKGWIDNRGDRWEQWIEDWCDRFARELILPRGKVNRTALNEDPGLEMLRLHEEYHVPMKQVGKALVERGWKAPEVQLRLV